jgi:cephalosporin hydroxylase
MIWKLFPGKLLEQYHKWYYYNDVWKKISFMGIETWKSVSDMWNYQEIIFKLKPSLIIEFGTNAGGATLYFSMILKEVNSNSKVFSVDINLEKVPQSLKNNNHIEFMTSSSTDDKVFNRLLALKAEFKGTIFAILDSDHSKNHVLNEMELLRNILDSGDYLVVEDSNINGNPILSGWGDGPMEAIEEYFRKYPDDYVVDLKRAEKFGFTFAPKGFLIRK